MEKTCKNCVLSYPSFSISVGKDPYVTRAILMCRLRIYKKDSNAEVEKDHTCDKFEDPRMNSTRFIEDEE